MWSNDDEYITLISSVECQVLKIHPITATNNNHDFTGNLLDIIDNWSEIAEKLKRTGELNHILFKRKRRIRKQSSFACAASAVQFMQNIGCSLRFPSSSIELNDI